MNNSENLPTDNNNKSIVKGKTMYNWETHDNQDKVIVDSINAIERTDSVIVVGHQDVTPLCA